MKKKFTEEQFKSWLRVFFPFGYSGDGNNDWLNAWYLGWFQVKNAGRIDFPMEVNLDGGGTSIVFHWYKDDADKEMTDAELASYIRGVVSMLDPAIEMDGGCKEGSTTLMFSYPEEEE